MKYIVTEIQKFENGQMSTPSFAYDEPLAAEAKYHSILASAAVSTLPVHSAIMYTEEAITLSGKCYKHEVQEQTEEV